MKYIISSLIFLSAIVAQVTEGMVEFNIGVHNALQIKLLDVDKKLVENTWKEYSKVLGKPNKKKGEFITKSVFWNELSNPIDWYMTFEKSDHDVWAKLCVISKEEFLSSANQNDNYIVIGNYLESFSYAVEKAKVAKRLESENKEFSKLQKKLNKLIKNYKNKEKSINKHNKKIKKAQKDIESNLKKQSELQEEISKQEFLIENKLDDPNNNFQDGEISKDIKDDQNKLKKLQKNMKKLLNRSDGHRNTIEKSTKNIKKTEKNKRQNLKKQAEQKEKISHQGKIVEGIKKLLESMKSSNAIYE